MCKSWCELIISLVIIIALAMGMWTSVINLVVASWIAIIAALVLLIHSFTCKSCFNDMPMKRK